MGTWGTAILSNDTSADIYANFFDLYNDGKNPTEIKDKLISENSNKTNDFWFALALALWETKSLPNDILEKVREIIKTETDLKLWRELDSSESDIEKRKIALNKYLVKLDSENPKAKARKHKSKKDPIFKKGTCLTFKLDNGNYGGAIVLESDFDSGYGYNLIVPTRINNKEKPSINDFKNSNVLVANYGNWQGKIPLNWFLPKYFKKDFSELFEIIGSIQIERKYDPIANSINAGFTTDWKSFIINPVNLQFEFELENEIKKSTSISKLIKQKRWWKF